MSEPTVHLAFEPFELDEANALLTRAGTPVPLPPKAFARLRTLARSPGRLTYKNTLLDAVWAHRFVSESVLNSTALLAARPAASSNSEKSPRR